MVSLSTFPAAHFLLVYGGLPPEKPACLIIRLGIGFILDSLFVDQIMWLLCEVCCVPFCLWWITIKHGVAPIMKLTTVVEVNVAADYLCLPNRREPNNWFQMADAEGDEDGSWRFGIAFVGVGLLFTIGMGVVSVILSRGLTIHDQFLWPTFDIQINQSARTLPTLSHRTRGTVSCMAASTSSETVPFSMVLRWLTGELQT